MLHKKTKDNLTSTETRDQSRKKSAIHTQFLKYFNIPYCIQLKTYFPLALLNCMSYDNYSVEQFVLLDVSIALFNKINIRLLAMNKKT